MHERSKNSVFTVGMKICTLQLMELGNIGIPMPSAECMGLYRGGLLYFVIRTTLLLGCAAVVVKRTFSYISQSSVTPTECIYMWGENCQYDFLITLQISFK